MAVPALAAFPQKGTVVEGKSFPGVAFGASRGQVYQGWGTPTFCQSTGQGFCTWQRSNGAVDLSFTGPGGGPPVGNSTDVVAAGDWSGLPGWRTAAGVTTANALSNPQAVPPKYPGSQVTRYGNGQLYRVLDVAKGIDIRWVTPTYSNSFYVWVLMFPAG